MIIGDPRDPVDYPALRLFYTVDEETVRLLQVEPYDELPFSLKPRARAPFAPLSARFLARETMALFAWNICDLHCYSVCFGGL